MEHREDRSALLVRRALPDELDLVLPVCVEAFADEAVSAWVEPVPALRLERTRALFEDSLRAAVDAGQLLAAFLPGGEPVAASLWIDLENGWPERPAPHPSAPPAPTRPNPTRSDPAQPPSATPPSARPTPAPAPAPPVPAPPAPASPGPAQPTPAGRADQRLAVVLAATGGRHPREPHVYLSAMAALPRRRGLGAGSAMLRHGLDRARGLGLPVYLEASTPRNRRLYVRHGFRDLGDPIRLPDGGPALQPMWLG